MSVFKEEITLTNGWDIGNVVVYLKKGEHYGRQ
jgi:hypothetical protein